MYYVYRFIDKDGVVIYVGKTKTSMKNRMSQHFSKNGHLSTECYDRVVAIEYLSNSSKIDMDIKELYYINKWKPEFNNKDKQDESLGLVINESDDVWKIHKALKQNYTINPKYNEIKLMSENKFVYGDKKVQYINFLLKLLNMNKGNALDKDTIEQICSVNFIKCFSFYDEFVYNLLLKHNVIVTPRSLTLNT